MSKLVYNGLRFGWVNTKNIVQEFRRDPSGADHVGTHFRIDIEAVVGMQVAGTANSYGENVIGVLPGELPAETLVRVREKLREPRRPLLYAVTDDQVLLDIHDRGDGKALDDANGPIPLHVNVTEVSQATLLVQFSVEAFVREACPLNKTRPVYLSNRWSEANTYDSNWLCTKRRVGLLVLSSQTDDPDDFRDLITPSVEPGFRRESAEYMLSPDGLNYSYSFVDKELMQVPPAPALRMGGSAWEHTPGQSGAIRYAGVDFWLEGPKGVDKADLLARGIRVVMGRMRAVGVHTDPKTGRSLGQAKILEGLGDSENRIAVHAYWRVKPNYARMTGNKGLGGAELVAGGGFPIPFPPFLLGPVVGIAAGLSKGYEFVNPPPLANAQKRDQAALPIAGHWVGLPLEGSNPTRGIAPPTRGSAELVKIVGAALADPCTALIQPPSGTLSETELVGKLFKFGGTNSITDTSPVGFDKPPAPAVSYTVTESRQAMMDLFDSLFAEDGLDGIYDHYACTSHYSHDPGICVLPSTKPGEKPQKVQLRNPMTKLRIEFTAKRTGGAPVIPDPSAAPAELWEYVGGTLSPESIDLAADGVTIIHGISGVYDYVSYEPCKVQVLSPVPPFLQFSSVVDAAKDTAKYRSSTVVFPVTTAATCNPFCCASQYLTGAELVSVQGPPPFAFPSGGPPKPDG